MLRSLLLLIFCSHNLICQATPLIGERVRSAKQDEFPFVVSISYSSTSRCTKRDERSHHCTGSLITSKHVLTAAHCVDGFENYSDLIVKVGSVDWRSATNHEIESWITHGDWDEEAIVYHDVAVIKLKSNVNSSIQLATLTEETSAQLYNSVAVTAGWGRLQNNAKPRYLMTAELIVLEPQHCPFKNFPSILKKHMPKIYLCTKAQPPIQLTPGDSGGPLFVNKNEIIAINGNSWSNATVAISEYQNLHPSVNFYKEFIDCAINDRAKVHKKCCCTIQ